MTSKAALAVLPAESLAARPTEVVPSGNVDPEAYQRYLATPLPVAPG